VTSPGNSPSSSPSPPAASRAISLMVLVAALGYFVDIYDLILFSVIRVRSLQALGVSGPALLHEGLFILNVQMVGMLVGGVFWGMLADRRGRLSVLFGSIILYSLANLANGIPDHLAALTGGALDTLDVYAIVRFVAGVGLAGELGAGITLVGESMRKETRGFGTTIVASVGICGAVVAVLVAKTVADWRTAYFIGGGLGLALLVLRVGVIESGMFQNLRTRAVSRGNFLALFATWTRARRYLSVILIGLPIWYVVGILISFSPELGRSLGMDPVPSAPNAVLAAYSGLALGDVASGFLSQFLRTRKKVLLGFIGLTALFIVAYFTVAKHSLGLFYAICFGLGIATGYWAVFVTVASEHFGTNLRGTVTTTAPNFVRGSLVPITIAFEQLRGRLGPAGSALTVGLATVVIALLALRGLDETYGRDLDFLEE
jgi:MFS transporter, putative metabolite:H+ symporter